MTDLLYKHETPTYYNARGLRFYHVAEMITLTGNDIQLKQKFVNEGPDTFRLHAIIKDNRLYTCLMDLTKLCGVHSPSILSNIACKLKGYPPRLKVRTNATYNDIIECIGESNVATFAYSLWVPVETVTYFFYHYIENFRKLTNLSPEEVIELLQVKALEYIDSHDKNYDPYKYYQLDKGMVPEDSTEAKAKKTSVEKETKQETSSSEQPEIPIQELSEKEPSHMKMSFTSKESEASTTKRNVCESTDKSMKITLVLPKDNKANDITIKIVYE